MKFRTIQEQACEERFALLIYESDISQIDS